MAEYNTCSPIYSKELVTLLNDIFIGFKIKAECLKGVKYRHFMLFDVALKPGCRINDITGLSDEIGLIMRSVTPIIVTPVPEEGILRIQATHCKAEPLHFETYYDYVNKNHELRGKLPFVIGEAFNGDPIIMDMALNPHLLVAGSTGSGKSVFLHTLIANAFKRDDVELYLSDTKKVEFSIYDKEMFSGKIMYSAYDYKTTLIMLGYLHEEMERRYCILSTHNDSMRTPYFSNILVIIDEVSDLILFDKSRAFEASIVKLAQKARAVGIHVVLATQRPSVDILTGIIKVNFPARVAFKVSSKVDSRVILDASGAESLAGKGDGIINNAAFNFIRFQSTFTNQHEVMKNF